MGIRIHKVLGWGFLRADLKNDPRFTPGIITNGVEGDDLRPRLIEFMENKRGTAEEIDYAIEVAEMKCPDLPLMGWNDVVKYSYYTTEKDRPIGPIVFTVPYCHQWFRFDDTMDYYESSLTTIRTDEPQRDTCRVIVDCEGQPTGIYPFNGSYVHRDKGERLVSGGSALATMERWSVTRMMRAGGVKFREGKDVFGTRSMVEWQRHIVPEVPLFIQAFCECFGVFREARYVHRLRPMIYTYWC